MVYFDHNATSILSAPVWQAMQEIAREPLNASSVHAYGRKARKLKEDARATILKSLNASHMRLVFTSSGTETNNWVLNAFDYDYVLISAIEHPSILKPFQNLVTAGSNAASQKGQYISVDEFGIVRLDLLEKQLKELTQNATLKPKILISVMLANNETGVIQPIKALAVLAKTYGAIIHTDAVQALGKIPLDVAALGVDMMTLAVHKCGGPVGVAALLVHPKLSISALLLGGGQEEGLRPGTENIPGIVGFAAALEYSMLQQMSEVTKLRNYLESQLKLIASDMIVVGEEVQRLGNTACLVMPNVDSQAQLIEFDLKGFAVSAGSACASGKITVSHVLTAMGIDEKIAQSAIRVSLAPSNTKQEIDEFIQAWAGLYQRIKGTLRV